MVATAPATYNLNAFNDTLFSSIVPILKLVQQGIQCSGTEFVAVEAQLLCEPQSVNRLFRRMAKDMDLYKTQGKISQHFMVPLFWVVILLYRQPITEVKSTTFFFQPAET
jgi:hypothetical protein